MFYFITFADPTEPLHVPEFTAVGAVDNPEYYS
jgi:hypothetical protein